MPSNHYSRGTSRFRLRANRRIHAYLFRDVYEWAGQCRTVNIAKGNAPFCRVQFIAEQLEQRFRVIAGELPQIKALGPGEFAARAAEHICELDAFHPFREGNGRTLRAFLGLLGERAGHAIDLGRIEPAAWLEAAIEAFQRQNYRPMADVIATAIMPKP